MKHSALYIACIVLINLAFTFIPPIEVMGNFLTVGSLIAGFVFIARDYAQREVGHKKVLLLMVIAGVLSYLMADPFVAIASVTAFAISELSDYLVYTFKKGSFKSKVLTSSLLSVPVDTAVFLLMINHLTLPSFLLMVMSKLVCLGYLFKREVT